MSHVTRERALSLQFEDRINLEESSFHFNPKLENCSENALPTGIRPSFVKESEVGPAEQEIVFPIFHKKGSVMIAADCFMKSLLNSYIKQWAGLLESDNKDQEILSSIKDQVNILGPYKTEYIYIFNDKECQVNGKDFIYVDMKEIDLPLTICQCCPNLESLALYVAELGELSVAHFLDRLSSLKLPFKRLKNFTVSLGSFKAINSLSNILIESSMKLEKLLVDIYVNKLSKADFNKYSRALKALPRDKFDKLRLEIDSRLFNGIEVPSLRPQDKVIVIGERLSKEKLESLQNDYSAQEMITKQGDQATLIQLKSMT